MGGLGAALGVEAEGVEFRRSLASRVKALTAAAERERLCGDQLMAYACVLEAVAAAREGDGASVGSSAAQALLSCVGGACDGPPSFVCRPCVSGVRSVFVLRLVSGACVWRWAWGA